MGWDLQDAEMEWLMNAPLEEVLDTRYRPMSDEDNKETIQ